MSPTAPRMIPPLTCGHCRRVLPVTADHAAIRLETTRAGVGKPWPTVYACSDACAAQVLARLAYAVNVGAAPKAGDGEFAQRYGLAVAGD